MPSGRLVAQTGRPTSRVRLPGDHEFHTQTTARGGPPSSDVAAQNLDQGGMSSSPRPARMARLNAAEVIRYIVIYACITRVELHPLHIGCQTRIGASRLVSE